MLHRERGTEGPPGTIGGPKGTPGGISRGAARIDAEAGAIAAWCGLRDPDEPDAAAGLGLAEILRHVEARSWRGLAGLVIEDVQWADDPGEGLGIAEVLARRLADDPSEPLLVIVTVDSGAFEDRPSLEARIDAIVADHGWRIDLDPLGDAETADLARMMAPIGDAPAERIAFHHAGRPGIVRQIILDWIERDWLVEDPKLEVLTLRDPADKGHDAPGPEGWVPETVQGVIERRIAGIGRRIVNERRFTDLVHLSALAGSMPRETFDAFAGSEVLAQALASGLWVERPDGLVLADGALCDVAVAKATARPDHTYLHRRLGRAFGRVAAEASGALECGWHAVRGTDNAFGVPWLLRAAQRAAATGRTADLERATKLARTAIDADRDLASLKPTALLWQARCHEARGDWALAGERFEQAAEALAAAGELSQALDALLGLGWARLRAHDTDGADARFSDVLARARQHKLLTHEARGIAGKAAVELRLRRIEDADLLYARAHARFTELHDPRGAGEAYAGQARVAHFSGRFDEAEVLYHNAIDAFRQGRDPLGGIRARLGLAQNRWQRTPDDLAHRMCAWCANQAGAHGATVLEVESRIAIADVARLRGDRAAALAAYEAASAFADRADAIDIGIRANLGLARLEMATGTLPVASSHARRAGDWLSREPGHPLWGAFRLMVSSVVAQRGEEKQTWQWLWSAQELGVAEGIDRDIAASLVTISEAAAKQRWSKIVRLAGKLAVEQLERLSDEAGATRLKQQVATALMEG